MNLLFDLLTWTLHCHSWTSIGKLLYRSKRVCVVKRLRTIAIRELIAFQVYMSQLRVGNAGPTNGRIASTGRLDRTGYQIRQDGTCDIGLKYEGRMVRVMETGLLSWGRLRWRSVDQKGNRDQQGDRDQGGDRYRDQRSDM